MFIYLQGCYSNFFRLLYLINRVQTGTIALALSVFLKPTILEVTFMKNKLLKVKSVAFFLLILVACGGENKSSEGGSQKNTEKLTIKGRHHTISKTASSKESQAPEPFAHAAPELRKQVNTLLENYITIKDQLVESSAEGASKAAAELLNNLKAFQSDGLPEPQKIFYRQHIEGMEKFIRNISEKKELEVQREHFSAITKHMYVLSKAFKANQETLYYQHCPMAFKKNGGYWLSDAQEIRNPYFGDKMMNCGEVTEVLKK